MNSDPQYIKPKDRPQPGRGKGGGALYEVDGVMMNIIQVAEAAGKSVHFAKKYLVKGSVSAANFIKRFGGGEE